MAKGRTGERRPFPSPLVGEDRLGRSPSEEGGRGRRAPPQPNKAPDLASRSQPSERGPAPPLSARASPESALPHKGGEGSGAGAENLILLGEFGRAHGLRGEVRLKSFTADPAAIATYGPLVADDGRCFVLTGVRPAGGAMDMLIARVEGVATREAAEALNRLRLHAPRDRLPPTEEDEFLAADLIGLAVETAVGDALGTVVAVPDYGGGDLLEIAPAKGGRSVLLPFTKAFVPAVDLAGKRVVVDPPDDLFGRAGDERP